MSTYRDERDAMRHRIEQLEEENAELRERLRVAKRVEAQRDLLDAKLSELGYAGPRPNPFRTSGRNWLFSFLAFGAAIGGCVVSGLAHSPIPTFVGIGFAIGFVVLGLRARPTRILPPDYESPVVRRALAESPPARARVADPTLAREDDAPESDEVESLETPRATRRTEG
ncbi:MAG: hypothetical protein AB7S26_04325 [Sandaracinaceae bacterium]